MSCYVDKPFCLASSEAQAKRVGARHGHRWCHLWADTEEELHAMAARIGMRRAWFQDKPGFPHYDLVPPRRTAAIRAGAIEASLRDHIMAKRRAAAALPPQPAEDREGKPVGG